MQNYKPSTETAPTPAILEEEAPRIPWHLEVGDLLAQAALLAARNGVDMESFMKGAWSAYVESRPGLRDEIEEMQIKAQLEALRENGRIGLA